FWPVVNNQNPAHHILVDLDAKNQPDLLGNAGTAPTRVAPFHGNHRIDEIFTWSLRTGPTPGFGRKQDAVLSFAHQAVEMQQCGRLENDGGAEKTRRSDE